MIRSLMFSILKISTSIFAVVLSSRWVSKAGSAVAWRAGLLSFYLMGDTGVFEAYKSSPGRDFSIGGLHMDIFTCRRALLMYPLCAFLSAA
jgi:hypothetical protein